MDFGNLKIKQEEIEAKIPCISEIPADILVNILSRLPVRTICQCRCVCKTWLDLLIDHHFAKTHLTRAPVSFLMLSGYRDNQPKKPLLVDLEAKATDINDCDTELSSDLNSLILGKDIYIADSCNGLLCLCKKSTRSPTYIINPVTGDYTAVLQAAKKSFTCSCRFGFCPKTNQYKVLRFFWNSAAWETEIYTVGTDSWRSLGKIRNAPFLLEPCDSFVNGSRHWLGFSVLGKRLPRSSFMLDSSFINSFDYTNETFQSVPPPRQLQGKYVKINHPINIGVLEDCLCICDSHSSNQCDIWIMKEYGVQESWNKQFIIHTGDARSYNPMKILNNGEMLLLSQGKDLVSYNFGLRRFKSLEICAAPKDYAVVVHHTPSFLSLKDIRMGENLEVLNVNPRDPTDQKDDLERS